MIRYLKFMLKRRTASAGFFSQSGTINTYPSRPTASPPAIRNNSRPRAVSPIR
ncbi:hypothetical protein [Candidatus Tisiphia endosymbiont of Parasteatoda lunata]|uniref:hypothetical protein n=1 Tax=Candidatus Tisiphia endosymbiont of Parasteatoda lunata TaxID=3066275 RepID=UPI00313DDA13